MVLQSAAMSGNQRPRPGVAKWKAMEPTTSKKITTAKSMGLYSLDNPWRTGVVRYSVGRIVDQFFRQCKYFANFFAKNRSPLEGEPGETRA